MTDDELIARLRSKIIIHTDAAVWMLEAADRIEQLVATNEALTAMRDTMSELWAKEAAEKNVLAGRCEDLEAKLAQAVEAVQAAFACDMIPKSTVADGGSNRHSEQVRVADMLRAALAETKGP